MIRKLINYLLSLISNERGESDSFRTMNVSLNMLLLAFFIALNSIAVIDEERIKKALGSLIGSFGLLPGGVSPSMEGGTQLNPPSDIPMEKIESISLFLKQLEKYALTEGWGEGFGIQNTGELTIMTLRDEILFDAGGVRIQKKIAPLLKQIGGFLKKSDSLVRIKGHCDKSSPPARYSSNWDFSAAKVLSVLRFFTESAGVSPMRFSIVGYGDSRPMFPNNTPKNRARNRRVEIVFGEDI